MKQSRSLLGVLGSLTDGLLKYPEDIIITVHPVLLLISHLQLDPGICWEEDCLAGLHRDGSKGTSSVRETGSRGNDLAELCLLLVLLRQEDTSLGLGDGLRTSDEDAICEGDVALEVGQHVYFTINNYSLKYKAF